MGRTGFYSTLIAKRAKASIPARSMDSFKWFDQEVGNMKGINRTGLLQTKAFEQVKAPVIGHMYMYQYRAKNADTMPFYDRFPLIFMVGPAEGGWYGLNMHYLPPRLRAILFDRLLQYMNNDQFDQTTKLRMTYDILKGAAKLKMFAPCFKHYLAEHIASKMVRVPADQWENVLYLPTDQFIGSKRSTIWTQVRKDLKNLNVT